MRMLFTGCTECGRSTTSVEGICPDCEVLRRGVVQRPRERAITLRQQLKHRHYSS
jgi:NMD protein affecting ribosome stability and mRNA decay